MADEVTDHVAWVSRPPGRGFAAARRSLRLVATVVAVIIGLQPITIGQYLNGRYAFLQLHSIGAGIAMQVALLLIPAAIWFLVAGGRFMAFAASALVVALEIQGVMGYRLDLAVHIPLGVLVVGGAVMLAAWTWTPSSARPRARRVRARPADAVGRPKAVVR